MIAVGLSLLPVHHASPSFVSIIPSAPCPTLGQASATSMHKCQQCQLVTKYLRRLYLEHLDLY